MALTISSSSLIIAIAPKAPNMALVAVAALKEGFSWVTTTRDRPRI